MSNFRVTYLKSIFLLAALALLSAPALRAQNTTSGQETDAITTAVPFLTISPNARSGAMGDAGVALEQGAFSTFWNPAAMAFIEDKFGFGITYTPWLRALGIPDINHAYLPAYYNFGEQGGVAGVSLSYFSLGNIQFTDNQGIETGNYNANEFALSGHYGRLLTDQLAIGGGLRYIRSDLAGSQQGSIPIEPAQSAAGDIFLFYKTDLGGGAQAPLGLNIGGGISNIGAKMTYNNQGSDRDFLPTTFRIGYALTYPIDDYNKITFTNDFSKLMVPSEGGQSDEAVLSGMFSSFGDAEGGLSEEVQEVMISLGAEYWYNDLFAVRAGYFHEDEDKGDRQYLTLGAGLQFKALIIDFAYLTSFEQNHPLQNTLRFSLGFNFN